MSELPQDSAYPIDLPARSGRFVGAPHPINCQCAGTGRWFTTKQAVSGGEVITGYGPCTAPQSGDPR